MGKYLGFTCLLVAYFAVSHAQIDNPVIWNSFAKKVGDKAYELHFSATLSQNWHLYSQDAGEDLVSTVFHFNTNPLLKLDGNVAELGMITKAYDPNLKLTLNFYTHKVEFVQKMKMKSAVNTLIAGKIIYVVCNDRKCLPAKDLPFSIKIDGSNL